MAYPSRAFDFRRARGRGLSEGIWEAEEEMPLGGRLGNLAMAVVIAVSIMAPLEESLRNGMVMKGEWVAAAAEFSSPLYGRAAFGETLNPGLLPWPFPSAQTQRTIVLDPGHGGPEIGAVHRDADGNPDVIEKNVNLNISLKLRDLLQKAGYRVVLTRDSDRSVSKPSGSYSTKDDLQARVDIANAARADLFISIHDNGSSNPDTYGTEVWYSRDRPFATRNWALAYLIQYNLLAQFQHAGIKMRDRGLKNDSNFRMENGHSYNLFVLGPSLPYQEKRPAQMPGALGESLFVSNDGDAALLRDDKTLNTIARAYFDAVESYFKLYPS